MGYETLKYEGVCYKFDFWGLPILYLMGENCSPSEHPLVISVIHNDERGRMEVRSPMNCRVQGPL